MLFYKCPLTRSYFLLHVRISSYLMFINEVKINLLLYPFVLWQTDLLSHLSGVHFRKQAEFILKP